MLRFYSALYLFNTALQWVSYKYEHGNCLKLKLDLANTFYVKGCDNCDTTVPLFNPEVHFTDLGKHNLKVKQKWSSWICDTHGMMWHFVTLNEIAFFSKVSHITIKESFVTSFSFFKIFDFTRKALLNRSRLVFF
jgi:hypothetical protein